MNKIKLILAIGVVSVVLSGCMKEDAFIENFNKSIEEEKKVPTTYKRYIGKVINLYVENGSTYRVTVEDKEGERSNHKIIKADFKTLGINDEVVLLVSYKKDRPVGSDIKRLGKEGSKELLDFNIE